MKDTRYKAVKSLIETGSIKSLKEVFSIIPLTTVRTDLGINYNTLRRRITNIESLAIGDIVQLANLIEVEPTEIFKLAVFDYMKANPKKS